MLLNRVTVSARDLEASIQFYRTLGLRLIVKSDHYARFECPDGGSTFSLHLNPDARGISETTVYFENDDLDGEVRRLKAAGIAFDSDPADQRWLWREAYLRDPAAIASASTRLGKSGASRPGGSKMLKPAVS